MLKPPRRRQLPVCLRLTALLPLSGCGVLTILTAAALAEERPLRFNPSFMHQTPGQPSEAGAIALGTLASHASLPPGRYQVEVLVNLAPAGRHALELHERGDGKGLVPCLKASLLRELGLREQSLHEPLPDDGRCVDLSTQVPGASFELDPGKLRLALSIPQIALRRDVAGKVAPERWDDGINAAFVSYQASAQHFRGANGISRSSQDLYLNSGVNIGGWRLRSNQSWRDDGRDLRKWSHANTYAQHDLPGSWGTLTLGETFSNGDVFRSLPFKGVQLATDMGMLPDVLQNYAPVIRGVAQSRAKLEVLQNGYPIYSTYVAPGPYVIDDLGIGGGSGDLEIVLTEADGQERRFIQPYSTLSNLLREGIWRYSAALGRYNSAEGLDEPPLWQATLARGGAWNTTVYGGVLGSEYYHAATLGAARDFGSFGALSFDATQARSDLGEQGQAQGQSYAMRYGKAFQTGTSLRFAGYRYSTEGYREFDEAVQQRNASRRYLGSRRSRLETSVYQTLGSRSSLSLTLSQDDYWHRDLQRRQYQFQFNTQYRRMAINLHASQSLNGPRSQGDRIIGLGITVPMDIGRSSNASFDVQESNGRYSERASLTGGALDNRLSYLASLANDERQRKTAAISVGLQTPTASLGAGYTKADDYRSVSLNASGAALAHAGGVVFGQYLGETNALVHVPDVPGVGLDNAPGASTDNGGYLLAAHMRPYRINQVALQTERLGPHVEIENGAMQLVPRRGAVVKATFKARQVSRLILTLQDAEGRPLPFGTQVSNAGNETLAVVGQAGQALVATAEQAQTLDIRWGSDAEQRCQLAIDPANMPEDQGYRLQTLRCPAP